MQLPTDPVSVREFEELVTAVEETRRRWLEAVANLENWLTVRQGRAKVPQPADRAIAPVLHRRFTDC